MKITKFGHACLLIEEKDLRIILDPGSYSSLQDNVKNIDVILITHEHHDHVSIDSVKKVLQNNPQAKIITNKGVGALLEKENIPYQLLEDGQSTSEKGVAIEGFGNKHAIIHSSMPAIENTGYMIANRLFYPGDAFIKPTKPVEILALPVGGPWMKISEAIDYGLEIKPKIWFAVHEGMYKNPELAARWPQKILESQGSKFMPVEIDKEFTL